MTTDAERMLKLLAAPFPTERVSWLPKRLAQIDGRNVALALAYIDARDVMARLDEICGPGNWQDEYQETGRGRVLCTLSLKIGEEWISKSDGSGESNIEAEKGGISGAFKRAAVKWGIGRYLYEIEAPWAECTVAVGQGGAAEFQNWTPSGRSRLRAALAVDGKLADSESFEAQVALPQEVSTFISQLEQQIASGEGSKFWSDHFARIPPEWKAYAKQEKERLKKQIKPRTRGKRTRTAPNRCESKTELMEAQQ